MLYNTLQLAYLTGKKKILYSVYQDRYNTFYTPVTY